VRAGRQRVAAVSRVHAVQPPFCVWRVRDKSRQSALDSDASMHELLLHAGTSNMQER